MRRYRGFEVVADDMRKTTGEITLPTAGTSRAMAYDFYSTGEWRVPPNAVIKIWTDVKAYMQDDECLIINVRSSMGGKFMLANSQGWIDSDYYNNETNEGNIGIFLKNISNERFTLEYISSFVKYGILDVNVQSQSIQGNYSVVYYQLTLVRPSTIYSSAEKSWSCNIGGNVFTGSGTIGGDGDMVLLSGTVTIGHDGDGSKGIYIYADIGLDITWSGEYIGTIYGEQNIGLPTIPRYPSVSQSVASKTETTITMKELMSYNTDKVIQYLKERGITACPMNF